MYKAEGDWSVQFQKAYAQYERCQTPPLDYKSYYIHGSRPTRLWFAACSGNHTISVDYECIVNAETGQTQKVVGESHKASDILEPNPAGITGSDGKPIKWTCIELNYTPTRIYSVNGVSARARVTWRDGEHWRRVDLDTALVPAKSE